MPLDISSVLIRIHVLPRRKFLIALSLLTKIQKLKLRKHTIEFGIKYYFRLAAIPTDHVYIDLLQDELLKEIVCPFLTLHEYEDRRLETSFK